MDNEGSALRPGETLPDESSDESTREDSQRDREAQNAAAAVFSFSSRRALSTTQDEDAELEPKPGRKGKGQNKVQGRGRNKGQNKGQGRGQGRGQGASQGLGQGLGQGNGKGKGRGKSSGVGKEASPDIQNKAAAGTPELKGPGAKRQGHTPAIGKTEGKGSPFHNAPAKSPANAPSVARAQIPVHLDVAVKPIAKPAKMRTRHWGIIASFFMLVIVPFVAIVSYLLFVAQPQYHSITGFTVRSQEESGANDLLGGLAQLAGGSTASDNDILYEFIRSQGMVERVNETVDLRTHYSQHWPNDWFFSIWDSATKEDLIWYWNRVVGVSYDQGTGLIEVQLTAFDPQTAVALTQAIVDVSQDQINRLNLAARTEAMQYAMTDLEEALEQLKEARQALTAYRTASQIVDPELDIGTRMGVMNSLQQELASALVEYDLLLGTTSPSDPRLRDAEQRIEVIRDRIAIERQNISSSSTETGGIEQDYPTLIAEFERLTTDVEFAEQVYFASLQAMEIARDEANRSSRYLATYISPTQADTSEHPRIFVLSALSLLFLTLAWSIGTLIYYSVRDKS